MSLPGDPPAPLSLHWAFVVQFSTDTHLEKGWIRGRVEHVVSRHATHFQSLEALFVFMDRMLREVAAQEPATRPEAWSPPGPHGEKT
jgi:hypothetical protein